MACYKVKLTLENGTSYSREFDEYDAMVAWIAFEPEAGIRVWIDGEAMDTESFMKLQEEVEELQ